MRKGDYDIFSTFIWGHSLFTISNILKKKKVCVRPTIRQQKTNKNTPWCSTVTGPSNPNFEF